jgi:C1A family cysteine protease
VADTDAKADRVTKYMRVNVSPTALKQAIAAGFPVVVGFDVYESIELDSVAETGILPMPAPGEQEVGGHAVLCVGYDDSTQRFLCRNSWGDGWGQGGYFTIPYAYLGSTHYAQDFWAVQQEVEGGGPTPPKPSDPLHELAALIRQEIAAAEQRAAAFRDWLAKHGL